MTPCFLVGIYHSFGTTHALCLDGPETKASSLVWNLKTIYQTSRRHIPNYINLHIHYYENSQTLISWKIFFNTENRNFLFTQPIVATYDALRN
jgi:hypothetical protein